MPRRPELLPGEYSQRLGRRKNNFDDDMIQSLFDQIRRGEAVPHSLLLYDNSFDSSRQWNETLLFVPYSPLTIHPPREVSVEMEIDAGGRRSIAIHYSQEDDREAVHNAIELRTAHQLCTACRDVFNYYAEWTASEEVVDSEKDGDALRWQNNVVHHASLTSLLLSGRIQGCFICRQISDKLDEVYPNLTHSLWSDYQIECCWTVGEGRENEQRMWFVMLNPSVQRWPMHNYKHLLRIGLWSKATFGAHFDKEPNRNQAARLSSLEHHPCANDNTTNDHVNTRALAQTWFSTCREDVGGLHCLCNRRDEDYLPSRLLSVQCALKSGKARLAIPAEQPASFSKGRQYASLSHCWGAWGSKENPVLLSTNIRSRISDGIDWKDLPKTFQDAFKIASWIGLDWLWIDSLCILQDSEKDWQKEASTMDRVYMNAEINISADFGIDSRAGCFATRTEIDISPLEISATQTDHTWLVTTENTFAWMRSAPSLSRAWIHRERQLSRRILHFTEKELVWECCGLGKACFASETMPGGSPFARVFNGQSKFQIQLADVTAAGSDDGQDKEEQLDKLHQLWSSTCQELSSKSITYPADLPVILSSLAREFHQRMNPTDEYVCGLWRSTIPESLTWCVPSVKPDGVGYIAPTWSWLSAATAVDLYKPSRYRNRRKAAQVLEIHTMLSTREDPYSRVTGGTLRMRGFLRRLHIQFVSGGGIVVSVVEHNQDGRDRLRLIGNDWNEEDGQVFRFGNEEMLSLQGQPLECWSFFTSFGEWAQDLATCKRTLDCILLEKVSGDAHGQAGHIATYKRMGVLDYVSDVLAFKLRYSVAPDATIPEAGTLRGDYIENPTMYGGQPKPKRWKFRDEGDGSEQVSGRATTQEENHERRDSSTLETSNERDPVSDIWTAMAEYIRRTRWKVIQRTEDEKEADQINHSAKKKEEASQKEGEEAGNKVETLATAAANLSVSEPRPKDEQEREAEVESLNASPHEESQSDDGSNGQGQQREFGKLIHQLRRHPSSGYVAAASEEEEKHRLMEVIQIDSQTVAYGNTSCEQDDPAKTLYQFDDALAKWRAEQGMFPWLRQLETTEIILI